MNLVGNSCVSAFIMRDCFKKEFNNPFCWAKIDFDSMYNLISKWDSINFENVEFIKCDNYYTAIIDKLVKVQYIHYLEDNDRKEITFEKTNVIGPNILDYVKAKYFSRLAKMKEPPTFLLAAGYWQEYYVNDNQIKKLLELNSKYPIIISMPNSKMNVMKSTNNIKIHNHSFKMGCDGIHRKLAYYIADYYWGIKGEEVCQALN